MDRQSVTQNTKVVHRPPVFIHTSAKRTSIRLFLEFAVQSMATCRRVTRDPHCPNRVRGFFEVGEPTPERPILGDKLEELNGLAVPQTAGRLSRLQPQDLGRLFILARIANYHEARTSQPDVLPRSARDRPCSRGYPAHESTISPERLSAGSLKALQTDRTTPSNDKRFEERNSPDKFRRASFESAHCRVTGGGFPVSQNLFVLRRPPSCTGEGCVCIDRVPGESRRCFSFKHRPYSTPAKAISRSSPTESVRSIAG